MTATAVPVTRWNGAYGDSWQDLIVSESFAHPAKAARGLSHRIYRHLLDSGYVRPGMVVLDPFAGIGGFALDALTYGLRYVGVELEPRFVALGQQNLDLWRQRYGFTGGTIVQGDSRRLRAVLAGVQVECVVGSPPFGTVEPVQDTAFFQSHRAEIGRNPSATGGTPGHYGTTPGQLGAMPPGALVSSPPYAGAGEVLGTHNGIDWSKAQDGGKVATPARQASGEGYGAAPGQLGRMPLGAVVSSPPYVESLNSAQNGIDRSKMTYSDGRALTATSSGPLPQTAYGTSAGQLGAMPPGAVVSSPPYEGSAVSALSAVHASGGQGNAYRRTGQSPRARQAMVEEQYGCSPGQLGHEQGDTFWSASAQIMAELSALLPPGAVCAWVLKAYVSKKQIVPFPDQWRALCEQHGFVLVEEIHASLVEDHGTQEGLFGESTQVRTEKKSFFRRLAEKKGSPRIDHETVLIVQKAGSGADVCCVSSPPWTNIEAQMGKGDHDQWARREAEGYRNGTINAHGASEEAIRRRLERQSEGYGTTPGNLGNLPVGRK